jgi:hypothetical protein
MRHIICGDIHGCLDELRDLVHKVRFDPKNDRFLALGDLIDRGPDPAGVIDYVRSIGAESLLGNHEENGLRWRRHEARKQHDPNYKNPMRRPEEERLAQWAAIPGHAWDWLADRPRFIRLPGNWVAVHAGAHPDATIEAQEERHLLRLRWIDDVTRKMVTPDARGDQPPNSTHWKDLWRGENIVYGHYTYASPEATMFVRDNNSHGMTIGIDTGCYHGNRLTVLILDESEPDGFSIESVPARKVYSPAKAWNE